MVLYQIFDIDQCFKIFFFTYYFMRFKFVFVQKEWRQFKQQKLLLFLDVIPFNNFEIFLMKDNPFFLH